MASITWTDIGPRHRRGTVTLTDADKSTDLIVNADRARLLSVMHSSAAGANPFTTVSFAGVDESSNARTLSGAGIKSANIAALGAGTALGEYLIHKTVLVASGGSGADRTVVLQIDLLS